MHVRILQLWMYQSVQLFSLSSNVDMVEYC